VIYLVWLLNLYNFMDGIDGIAGMEALTVCLCGAVLYILCLPEGNDWVVPLLMAGAVAGFLVWNFPRARIFMGDAGSGFIGIMLGAMSVYAGYVSPELFWAWLILLGAFIVDATVTLVRRGLRGEKVYEAHRSHAYQHAARKAGSHIPVTLAFAGINLLWLFPLAVLVTLGRLDGFAGLVIAYVPLVVGAMWFKAGVSR
jgi:Fuc2NAc and GlcNAc transferase